MKINVLYQSGIAISILVSEVDFWQNLRAAHAGDAEVGAHLAKLKCTRLYFRVYAQNVVCLPHGWWRVTAR